MKLKINTFYFSSKLPAKTDATFMENNSFLSHKRVVRAEADSTSDTGNSETSETKVLMSIFLDTACPGTEDSTKLILTQKVKN